MGGTWKRWSADELEYLLKNHKSLSYAQMAKHLGRSRESTKSMGIHIGCTLTKEEFNKKKHDSAMYGLNFIDHTPKYENVRKRILKEFQLIIKYYPDKIKELMAEINKSHKP